MIFDSPHMQELRKKYTSQPDYKVPQIVLLDRNAELADERDHLEELIVAAPATKHNDWLGRLINEEDEQHLSAWFEMMLYGWLRTVGQIEVEPMVEGNYPDFSLSIDSQRIMIEARVILHTQNEREHRRRTSEVIAILESIERPYLVDFDLKPETLMIGQQFDGKQLAKDVIEWLDTTPTEPFLFQDKYGNSISLEAKPYSRVKRLAVAGTTDATRIESNPLKIPLREKAAQHKAIRRAGYPYVLAILLESWQYSAEEVVEAWLGRTQTIYDVESRQIVEERIDRTGIHFAGAEIRHKTVSGTLVFRRSIDVQMQRHELRAWYIQNPFASTPLEPTLFPVEGRYVVVGRSKKGFSMGWKR